MPLVWKKVGGNVTEQEALSVFDNYIRCNELHGKCHKECNNCKMDYTNIQVIAAMRTIMRSIQFRLAEEREQCEYCVNGDSDPTLSPCRHCKHYYSSKYHERGEVEE